VIRLRCARCRTIQEAAPEWTCHGCDAPLSDAQRLPSIAQRHARTGQEQGQADQGWFRALMVVLGALCAAGVAAVRFAATQDAACTFFLFTVPAVTLFITIPISRRIGRRRLHVLFKALLMLATLIGAFIGSFFLLMFVCESRRGGIRM
jgi:hypothetical protein